MHWGIPIVGSATNGNCVLGNERFTEQIAQVLGRRVVGGKARVASADSGVRIRGMDRIGRAYIVVCPLLFPGIDQLTKIGFFGAGLQAAAADASNGIKASQGFSWSAVGRGVAQGALNASVSQVANLALGQQKHFDWAAVAADAVVTGLGQGLGDDDPLRRIPGSSGQPQAFDLDNVFGDTLRNTAYDLADRSVVVAIEGHGKFDIESIAADAFGNALGNSIVGAIKQSEIDHQVQNLSPGAKKAYDNVVERYGSERALQYALDYQSIEQPISVQSFSSTPSIAPLTAEDLVLPAGAYSSPTELGPILKITPSTTQSNATVVGLNLRQASAPLFTFGGVAALPDTLTSLLAGQGIPLTSDFSLAPLGSYQSNAEIGKRAIGIAYDANATSSQILGSLGEVRAALANPYLSADDRVFLGNQAFLSIYARANAAGVVHLGSLPDPQLTLSALQAGGEGVGKLGQRFGSAELEILPSTTGNAASFKLSQGSEEFRTFGLNPSYDQIEATSYGQSLVGQIAAGNRDLSPDAVLSRAQQFLNSGSGIPSVSTAEAGQSFFKLIGTDSRYTSPNESTGYFMDAKTYDVIRSLPPEQIADALGLPNASPAYNAFSITPRQGETPLIFRSSIAPASSNGAVRYGGFQQSIIPNRSQFTPPSYVETLGPGQ
ncbi:hypothetical protein [Solimonas terrae]|uniref:Uncharacterized protein n=1 Tax=Solimonas terrae TaxID=1396819 RepID=A0A6M2BTR7_9GAMM|nr:hypothetical protein [Solimonas terrae]NGY05774.1 hypothetical protein [Solimonas terrae]